jgi:hypothetical protein
MSTAGQHHEGSSCVTTEWQQTGTNQLSSALVLSWCLSLSLSPEATVGVCGSSWVVGSCSRKLSCARGSLRYKAALALTIVNRFLETDN